MSTETAGAASANWVWIAAGAGFVAVAATVGFMVSRPDVPPVAAPDEQPVVAIAPDAQTPADVTRDAAATDAPASAPTSDAANASANDPAFDVVRVDPDGNAVVAGHAAPGSEMSITLNGEVVDTVEVDASGNFVSLLDLPVTTAGQLGLRDETGALASGSTVIIQPSAPQSSAPQPSAAQVVAAPDAPQPNENTSVAAPQTLAETPSDAVPEAPAASEPAEPTAPRVLLADRDGITVLQDGAKSLSVQNVVIDAITYDDSGDVALSGRGQEGANVRVYLNNNPVQTTSISQNGQWRLPLPAEVDSGVYTLRVDELAPDGTVTSRTETPFKREEPEQVAAANAQTSTQTDGQSPVAPIEAVTVQPGSTLWAIARDQLGEGTLYVQVFEANKDKIRNPDLIYPGQVFNLPGAD